MQKTKYLKLFIFLYYSFILTILLFTIISGKHVIEIKDGLWFHGEYIYGFPLPYLWKGINSLSIQIVIRNMMIDFLIYFIFVLIAMMIFSRLLKNNFKSPKKENIVKIMKIAFNLYAWGAIIYVLIFSSPISDFTWSHDLQNENIICRSIHFGFYP